MARNGIKYMTEIIRPPKDERSQMQSKWVEPNAENINSWRFDRYGNLINILDDEYDSNSFNEFSDSGYFNHYKITKSNNEQKSSP